MTTRPVRRRPIPPGAARVVTLSGASWSTLASQLDALDALTHGRVGYWTDGDDATPGNTDTKLSTLESAATRIEQAAVDVATLPTKLAGKAKRAASDAVDTAKDLAQDVETSAQDLSDEAGQRLSNIKKRLAKAGEAVGTLYLTTEIITAVALLGVAYLFFASKRD